MACPWYAKLHAARLLPVAIWKSSNVIEFYLKCDHVAGIALMLRVDAALCLKLISEPLLLPE